MNPYKIFKFQLLFLTINPNEKLNLLYTRKYSLQNQYLIRETENPVEMQREGWQAILNNFKKYVEVI